MADATQPQGTPMTSQTTARVAWAVCGLSAAFGMGTIVLALLNHTSLRDFVVNYSAVGPIIGISSPLLGALIITRHPTNRIGWVLCALGAGLATTMFAYEYGKYALVTRPGSLPGPISLIWWYNWSWMPVVGLTPFVFLLFPDGQLRNRRWRPAAWAGTVTLVVPPAVVAVVTWPYRGLDLLFADELLPETAPEFPLLEAVESAYFVALVALIAAGMASVFVRLRHATGMERQQVKWLLYGGGVAVAITAVTTIFPTSETGVTALLTFVGLLGAIAVAVLRYRLYDIDRIINRTLVYGLLTGILGAGYAVAVLILGPLAGQDRSSLVVAGATLAVAAAFQPARRRIQDQVDRRFNRRRYDAARTIQAFSTRLRQEVDLDALTAELVAVVDQTMEPARVSLWLRPHPEPASRRAGQREGPDPARR